MMAGLHEIRVRKAEKEYNLRDLTRKVKNIRLAAGCS